MTNCLLVALLAFIVFESTERRWLAYREKITRRRHLRVMLRIEADWIKACQARLNQSKPIMKDP